ncbi:hypothetical protein TrCOL_g6844 [Triparma columacea]|uniref:Tc1-like transposase DDE domain-containing protein n=1 Tax=Triparma columacea TaxID=722753 RepID=A0A9W7GIT2_9STRA|nr:hypothetical protein TrCOL_g6844 [Triparma columacea]
MLVKEKRDDMVNKMSTIRKVLSFKRKKLTKERVAHFVHAFDYFLNEKEDVTAVEASKKVGKCLSAKHQNVKRIMSSLEGGAAGSGGKEIDEVMDKILDSDGRKANKRRSLIDPRYFERIESRIGDLVKNDEYITREKVATICEEVTEEDAPEGATGVKVSERTAGRLLNTLGYHFGALRNRYTMTPSKIERVEDFLKDFNQAIVDQAAGKCIIVYMDETYCHKTQQRRHGWRGKANKGGVGSWNVGKTGIRKEKQVQCAKDVKGNKLGAKGGPRMIITHAFSKEGLVCLQNDDGDYIEFQDTIVPERELSQHAHSAGMVYEANKATGDYHDNMDSHVFMLWVKQRLLQTMIKKGNKRKIVLVLDNAPYHREHQVSCPNPLTSTKKDNIKTLQRLFSSGTRQGKEEIKSLTVTRHNEEHTFQFEAFGKFKRGKKRWKSGGPDVVELQVHTQRVVEKFAPEWLKTDLEAFMEEEGHQVIYTPPYLCSFQPIERLWAIVKGAVASEWREGRTLPEAFADLNTAFYGGIGAKTGIPYNAIKQDTCERMIKASIQQMDLVIEQFGVRCSGRVGEMEYDSDVEYEVDDDDDSGSDDESDDDAEN